MAAGRANSEQSRSNNVPRCECEWGGEIICTSTFLLSCHFIPCTTTFGYGPTIKGAPRGRPIFNLDPSFSRSSSPKYELGSVNTNSLVIHKIHNKTPISPNMADRTTKSPSPAAKSSSPAGKSPSPVTKSPSSAAKSPGSSSPAGALPVDDQEQVGRRSRYSQSIL